MSVITILGVDLGAVAGSANSSLQPQVPAFKVGTRAHTDTGHVAVYLMTSAAAINPATTVTISANGQISAGAAQSWISQNTTTTETSGYCWFRTKFIPNIV